MCCLLQIAIIIKNMLAGTVLTNSTSTGGKSATNTLHATLLSAIPYCCAAFAMWLMACSSHKFKEKELHIGTPWMVGGICLAFFEPVYRQSFAGGFSVIVIALTLAYSSQSVMFARVTGEQGCVPVCHSVLCIVTHIFIAAVHARPICTWMSEIWPPVPVIPHSMHLLCTAAIYWWTSTPMPESDRIHGKGMLLRWVRPYSCC